jgi:3-hydroxybutyryl-CoA dehydrogenase
MSGPNSPGYQGRSGGRVAVFGTGTMGQGIAQVLATSGYTTHLYDSDRARTDSAIAAIDAQLAKMVAKGKIDLASHQAATARLIASSTIEAASKDTGVIIEAIPESMELKITLLIEALKFAHKSALIASNTSSLSITEIGARIGAADRTCGLHFFNPPPVMELVEVVRGISTSSETIDRALAFVATLKKTPIVVRDVPGFASSRLGVILGAEAIRMLESGVASAGDIDRAMELGYRHPMGPLKLTDLVGLDVRLAILDHLHKEVGEQFRAPALLRQMVRAGKLGKKSGEGFYVWKEGVAELK